jgi:hypothetical protein
VGGKSETRLSQKVPFEPAEITNRVSAVSGAAAMLMGTSNFFHCVVMPGTVALA